MGFSWRIKEVIHRNTHTKRDRAPGAKSPAVAYALSKKSIIAAVFFHFIQYENNDSEHFFT